MSYVTVAVSVGGALYQGAEANQNGKIAKIFAESQARMDEASALETAKIIRRAGRKQVGAARGAYAASGVRLDEGSAAEVQEEMSAGVEHDAFQAILEGRNRAAFARHEGALAAKAGKDAQTASIISALGTASSAYSKSQSGWKTGGAKTAPGG
jgi:hypothetical protein